MQVAGLSPLPRLSREPRKPNLEPRTVFNKHSLPIKTCSPRKPKLTSKELELPVLVSRVVLRLNDHPTTRLYHRFTPDLSFDRAFLERQLVPLRSRASPSPHHSPEPFALSLLSARPRVKALVPIAKPLSPWNAALDSL